jgi:hypothetical protein
MDREIDIRDADLELLLAEADREQPILTPRRRDEALEAREQIDEQILAGLVKP